MDALKSSGGLQRPHLGWIAFTLHSIVGVVFVFAAVDKAISPDETLLVMLYLFGHEHPPALISSMITMLLVLEVILGVCLLTRTCLRIIVPAAVATLVLFTLVLARMLGDPASPESCGCGQMFSVILQAEASALFGVVRNMLLIAFVLVGARIMRIA